MNRPKKILCLGIVARPVYTPANNERPVPSPLFSIALTRRDCQIWRQLSTRNKIPANGFHWILKPQS